ncbi:hypothetical protein GPJ56_010631 [Histomonas meleagridis]|uniref:uncharacterized protein n=1 Tax=Histomonas meleagridis TaxID=135588 RepID=UPI0035596607|nr:hypothetical protein GPJ56_010631 [Histomonas meleagridis]KAH0804026.1 hypothetical protein GO595_002856 [Histomonas meleagridis]
MQTQNEEKQDQPRQISNDLRGNGKLDLEEGITMLPFIFQESPFFAEHREQIIYSPPVVPVPSLSLMNPFKNIKHPISLEQIPTIFQQIAQIHEKEEFPYYIEEPKQEFTELFEKVKEYLKYLIPYELIVTYSNIPKINFNTIKQYVSEPQFYVLCHVLYHFKFLILSPVYSEPKQKEALYQKLLFYLSPPEIYSIPDFPFVVEASVCDIFNGPSDFVPAYILYKSKSEVYVVNHELCEKSEFCPNLQTSENNAVLRMIESNKYIPFNTSMANKFDLLYPSQPSDQSFNGSSVISNIFRSLVATYSLPAVIYSALAKVLMTNHQSIQEALISTIYKNDIMDGSKKIIDHLGNVYHMFGQTLRFLKLVIMFEITRCKDSPNQLLRQNNTFVQCIIDFVRTSCQKLFRCPLRYIFEKTSELPLVNYTSPTDNDVKTVEKLFDMFWGTLFNTTSYLSNGVKCVLREIRIWTDKTYKDETLNHRGLVGLFFLRILLPALSSPELLGIDESMLEKDSLKKVTVFSKIILNSITFESYALVSTKFEEVIKKNSKNLVRYLELITETNYEKIENKDITMLEFQQSFEILILFIKENIGSIAEACDREFLPSTFADELLCELYNNLLQI